MNGDSSRMMAEIRAAIAKGILTQSEIERRLEEAIAAEIEKEDASADLEVIRACQSLLWELDTHGEKELSDTTEQSLANFKERAATKDKRKHNVSRIVIRTVAAAAAVIVLGFGVDALLHHEWLQGQSTDDEQQYVISGHEVDPNTINAGQADDDLNQFQEITTTNLDEAIEVLGFSPALPQWMPDGWTVSSYEVLMSSSSRWFITVYKKDEVEYDTVYQIQYFGDVDSASSAYEQNMTGEEHTLRDGRTVYIAENYEDTTCLWLDGLACYNLMGPENSNTYKKVIESVKESP